MSQAERLKAIEHQLQSLVAHFCTAADRGKAHGDLILTTLRRVEKKLDLHIHAADSGHRILNTRVNENNRRILQITKLIERIRTATTTPCPDPESPTPEKHLLPIRESAGFNIDTDHLID